MLSGNFRVNKKYMSMLYYMLLQAKFSRIFRYLKQKIRKLDRIGFFFYSVSSIFGLRKGL